MSVFQLAPEHLVDQLPCGARVLRRHLLDGIADMDHDEIAELEIFILDEEQTDVALDTFGRAAGHEAVDFDDLHGNAKAHRGLRNIQRDPRRLNGRREGRLVILPGG